MGLVMMLLVSGICLYTAYRILQTYSLHSRTVKISEFGDLCGLLLGTVRTLHSHRYTRLSMGIYLPTYLRYPYVGTMYQGCGAGAGQMYIMLKVCRKWV